MNKKEFIDSLAQTTNLTKIVVEKVVEEALTAITNTLAKGEEVVLSGFGTFKVKDRKAKQGRNPKTGETVQIPAKKAPVFKAGKGLKGAIAAS